MSKFQGPSFCGSYSILYFCYNPLKTLADLVSKKLVNSPKMNVSKHRNISKRARKKSLRLG